MEASNAEKQPRAPRPGEIPAGRVAPGATAAPARTGDGHATAEDFIAANRIHVRDGSFFIGPGLALHPRELDPKNEAALRAKLTDTYKFDAPSFYDDPKRAMIAVQLGALIPPTLQAERASLMQQITQFNTKLQTGAVGQAAEAAAYRNPMQAMVGELNSTPQSGNPLGIEHATNGMAFYLLIREALTRKGYLSHVSDYVDYYQTPDQVLGEMSNKLGISVRDMREAALHGLGAVGQKLGLDDATVYDIQSLSQYLAQHHFSLNAIEHWHLGRIQQPNASIEQKIAIGMPARIERDVVQFRGLAKGQYDVPDAIKAEEKRIAKALDLLDPVQRDILYKTGYNICFTPDKTADKIADYPGIYGLNRKLANDLRDIDGNYYIYFAGQMDEKKSLRTLVHEVTHVMWPTRFSPQELQEIDRLGESDLARLTALETLTTTHKDALTKFIGAYQAGDANQKKAVAASADEYFRELGVTVSEILPHLRGPEQLRYLVAEASSRLNVEGDYYNHTNYHNPSVRFREMLSRYSELRYVEHREKPELQAMLSYVVPGMTRIFSDYYLPHLHKLDQELSGHNKQPTVQTTRAEQTPMAKIDASTAQTEDRVHSAFSALSQMGIDPSGTHARC